MELANTRRPVHTHVDAEGHIYDVVALLEMTKGVPPAELELDVTKLLDADVWSNGAGTRAIRLRSYYNHTRRVLEADTHYPILVRPSSAGESEIVDGNHRLLKVILDQGLDDGDKVRVSAVLLTDAHLLASRIR